MIMAVMERRREIGTLRAIGARRRVIFSMVVGESLMLSLVGVILAMPLTAFANNLFFGYFLSTEVFMSWLKSFWVAILIGILAALLPAWQAVRVDPLEALRYE
jgi:putative ABC transport system permease protein